MTMTDPIADMLTRVRNAQAVGHKTVEIPFSTVKRAILQVLQDEGYILGFTDGADAQGHKTLVAELKYFQGKPVIEELRRVSKPGLRKYSPAQDIPMVRTGLGVTIISTSKGVMSDTAARQQNVGGEVLCQVF